MRLKTLSKETFQLWLRVQTQNEAVAALLVDYFTDEPCHAVRLLHIDIQPPSFDGEQGKHSI